MYIKHKWERVWFELAVVKYLHIPNTYSIRSFEQASGSSDKTQGISIIIHQFSALSTSLVRKIGGNIYYRLSSLVDTLWF